MQHDATPRRLIWVSIIHTPEDMGRLRGEVREARIRGRSGGVGWESYARAAAAYWREARRRIEALDLDFARVRLYQDALPVCGYEEKIVRELAQGGAANYRLLADLMDRGAALTGTESPALLVEDYEMARAALSGRVSAEHEERARTLLDERDAFIAARIDETLAPGEIGLILLGRPHSLEGRCPADIRLERIDPADAVV